MKKPIKYEKLKNVTGGREGDNDVCIFCGIRRIDKTSYYCEKNEEKHVHVFTPDIKDY